MLIKALLELKKMIKNFLGCYRRTKCIFLIILDLILHLLQICYARYNYFPIRRIDVKHILHYFKGTTNMNLIYPNDSK